MSALVEIARLKQEAAEISRELTNAVATARERGFSWARITEALAFPNRYASLGGHFPTGSSTTAIRSYYVGRSTSDGKEIS